MESKVKIGLLGDSKVGKTSIIQRFFTKKYEEDYLGFANYRIDYTLSGQKYPVEFTEINTDNIDTIKESGNFHSFAFIFDFSNQKTKDKCLKLINEVEPDTVYYILMNKIDLISAEDRQLKFDEIFNLVPKEQQSHFAPISAKSGEFVDEIIHEIIKRGIDKYRKTKK